MNIDSDTTTSEWPPRPPALNLRSLPADAPAVQTAPADTTPPPPATPSAPALRLDGDWVTWPNQPAAAPAARTMVAPAVDEMWTPDIYGEDSGAVEKIGTVVGGPATAAPSTPPPPGKPPAVPPAAPLTAPTLGAPTLAPPGAPAPVPPAPAAAQSPSVMADPHASAPVARTAPDPATPIVPLLPSVAPATPAAPLTLPTLAPTPAAPAVAAAPAAPAHPAPTPNTGGAPHDISTANRESIEQLRKQAEQVRKKNARIARRIGLALIGIVVAGLAGLVYLFQTEESDKPPADTVPAEAEADTVPAEAEADTDEAFTEEDAAEAAGGGLVPNAAAVGAIGAAQAAVDELNGANGSSVGVWSLGDVTVEQVLPAMFVPFAEPLGTDPDTGLDRYVFETETVRGVDRSIYADWTAVLGALPQADDAIATLAAGGLPALTDGQLAVALATDGDTVTELTAVAADGSVVTHATGD